MASHALRLVDFEVIEYAKLSGSKFSCANHQLLFLAFCLLYGTTSFKNIAFYRWKYRLCLQYGYLNECKTTHRQTEIFVKKGRALPKHARLVLACVKRDKLYLVVNYFPSNHNLKMFKSKAYNKQNAFKVTWMNARQHLANFPNRRIFQRLKVTSLGVWRIENWPNLPTKFVFLHKQNALLQP